MEIIGRNFRHPDFGDALGKGRITGLANYNCNIGIITCKNDRNYIRFILMLCNSRILFFLFGSKSTLHMKYNKYITRG